MSLTKKIAYHAIEPRDLVLLRRAAAAQGVATVNRGQRRAYRRVQKELRRDVTRRRR